MVRAGECAAFVKTTPDGHRFINTGPQPARYLEVGTRSAGDAVAYPDIDMAMPSEQKGFAHKDRTPYPKR